MSHLLEAELEARKKAWEDLKGAIESRIALQDQNDELGSFIAGEMNICLGFVKALEATFKGGA